MNIASMLHPYYIDWQPEYDKWRLTYNGGRAFISKYLEKFDAREDTTDFETRRKLSYCPAFAKECINEIKNGIYQRMNEISRKGGSDSYVQAIEGKDGGVDLQGSNMNTFIGQNILPEMMVMGKVGVWVDMPKFEPTATLAQFQKKPRPYLYYFQAEDIVNWSIVTREAEVYFTHLLLRERRITTDETTGLPSGEIELFRLCTLEIIEDRPQVRIKIIKPGDASKKQPDSTLEEYILDLPMIPFVLFDITNSLLRDVADYQIGLLNLASSDLNYALKANFTFYVEPYDVRAEDLYKRKGPLTNVATNADGSETVSEATSNDNGEAQEIRVGVTRGRRYPMEADPPSFIHPSSEPLRASMDKQKQMREEMRQLLNLAISNVAPSRASAESKRVDQLGLESGLASIGLELQGGERDIAKIWEAYLGKKDYANVVYPSTYSLKTDMQRLEEANELKELKAAVPSKKFHKQVAIKVVDTLFEGKLPTEELEAIRKEILDANYITSDPEEIEKAMELGLCQAETASNALGFDGAKEVPKAQKEHAERLARIAIAQSKGQGAGAARGVGDQDPEVGNKSAEDEKSASK